MQQQQALFHESSTANNGHVKTLLYPDWGRLQGISEYLTPGRSWGWCAPQRRPIIVWECRNNGEGQVE